MRGSFHQPIWSRFNFFPDANALNCPQIIFRKTSRAQHVIDVISIAFVGWNSPRRGMRLFEQTEFLEFAHNIANYRRAPTAGVSKFFRYRMRADGLSSNQMFPNDG